MSNLGPGSQNVNGQLIDFPQGSAYVPPGFGPQSIGVPQVSPSYPPYMGWGVGSPMGSQGVGAVGGYGTADNNGTVAAIANAHPWNLRVSPVLWVVILLPLSLLLLRAIHWRETLIEGHEGASLLGVGEKAEGSASA